MKRAPALLAVVLLLLAVCSCDFFRGLAGRPRSAQIRQKRNLIEKYEARAAALRDSIERARMDSSARAERYVADSLYAVDSLTRCGKLRKASRLGKISSRELNHRYYVVVGSFSNEKYAARLAARYAEAGFKSQVFRYRSGLNAVFVAPADRISEAFEEYRRIIQLPYASKETWILVNE